MKTVYIWLVLGVGLVASSSSSSSSLDECDAAVQCTTRIRDCHQAICTSHEGHKQCGFQPDPTRVGTLCANGNGRCGVDGACLSMKSKCDDGSETYDYIVVGSGPGGAVAAHRLAANPHVSVLLVEAGPNLDNLKEVQVSDYPVLNFIRNIEFHYQFPSGGQPGVNYRSYTSSVVRALGGCSTTNGEVWVVPPTEWLNRLAAVVNDPRWGAAAVNGMEDVFTAKDEGGNYVRGSGLLPVIQAGRNTIGELGEKLEAAGQALFGTVPGESNSGATFINSATMDSTRDPALVFPGYQDWDILGKGWSTIFLQAGSGVEVRVNTTATRVNFEGTHAIGITVLREGVASKIRARRGVVLSGGVLNTAKLLQVSGVGPAKALAELNIEPVAINEAVGSFFRDHGRLAVSLDVDETALSPLASAACKAQRNKFFLWSAMIPDASRGPAEALERGFQIDASFFAPTTYAGIAGIMLHTTSMGKTGARGPDATWKSIYEPNFLETKADQDSAAELALQLRLYADKLHELYPALFKESTTPVFSDVDFKTNAGKRLAWAKDKLGTEIHESGGCRMGPNDGTNCASSEGAVYGTRGLYVADNSLFPLIPPGNTQSAAYLAGNVVGKILAQKN